MDNILVIDGFDFSAGLQWQGITWEDNDIDSEDSGRETRDGLMYRSVITDKRKIEVTMMPMDAQQVSTLLGLLKATKYHTVTYPDPISGVTTKSFYNSSRSAQLQRVRKSDAARVWENIKFTLTER
jgi:hypothetical protein